MNASAKRSARKGIAAVQFAVILSVLLPLTLGMFEIGRIIHVRQVLMAAARECGRQATAGMPVNDLPAVFSEYLSNAGLPTNRVNVNVAEVSVGFAANPLTTPYRVTASIPLEDVSWVSTYWFTDAQDLVTVQSVWPRTEI